MIQDNEDDKKEERCDINSKDWWMMDDEWW
jgi:hypothetical protein